MGKAPKFGVNNYKGSSKKKRPGRHKKRLNKHEKRSMKKQPYKGQGR
mgnify:CR=1 FL=1|jgi:hypothetical protein|tara:strand:+ start:4093 stop:4233 length:141 start_codon:yes stop_codon:yes gene_type:complete